MPNSKRRAPARQRVSGRVGAAPAALDDLGALSWFVRAVEAESFSSAARRAGTTTSAISKRIAGMEERLGVRLFERTTRRAQTTDAGRALYEHARRLLEEATRAEEAVSAYRGQLVGRIRVSAPVTFGQMHIAPLVGAFLEQHPGLSIALSLNDAFVDLLASGVDVAVRSGRSGDSSLLSKKLASDARVVCASPKYLAKHGTPRVPEDLLRHACLRHSMMQPGAGWLFETPAGPTTIAVAGQIEVDHVGTLRDAALASRGIVYLPRYAVVQDLKAQRLVSLLAEFVPEPAAIRALWAAGKQPVRRVNALVEFLAIELPKRLDD
ncbi:MAG TPA: LysR family transcriptional regulator [Polyangiaceae bacterium]|nr:LysR family transcriptional regulator [Polyangiaceae bacterium]